MINPALSIVSRVVSFVHICSHPPAALRWLLNLLSLLGSDGGRPPNVYRRSSLNVRGLHAPRKTPAPLCMFPRGSSTSSRIGEKTVG